MLVLVNIGYEYPEEWIRQPPRHRRVREVGVDHKDSDEGKYDSEAQAVEAPERVLWPDYAVAILGVRG